MAYINFDGITLNCDKVNYCKKLSTSTFGVYFDNGSNIVFTYNATKDGAHGSLDAKLNNLVGLLNSCSNNMDVDIVEEGGATNLDGLTDVNITNPTSTQVLKFDGTNWINDTMTINLENMENVTITNPANSQVLTFNGTEWVNSVLPSGSAECCDIIDSVVETENTDKTLRSAETKGAQCYMLFYGYPTDKSEELTYFWKLVDMSVFNFGA
jgi:hypothetical protein